MVVLPATLIAILLTILAAAVKSVKFYPSKLTDFELKRRAHEGNETAAVEAKLRRERSLLLALRDVIVALLLVAAILLVGSVYGFGAALVLGWVDVLAVEALSGRLFLRRLAEKFASRHQPQLWNVARHLRPVLRLLHDGTEPHYAAGFASKDEFLHLLQSSRDVLSADELVQIRRALHYKDILIKDVMMPRDDVATIDETDTIGPLLLDMLHKSGQTYFPVIQDDSLDRVLGILWMTDLVPPRADVKRLSDVTLRKAHYLYEGETIDVALHAFLRTRQHLFIVVNEFEETTGAVSIETILQQTIGRRITDGFDQYEDRRAVVTASSVRPRDAK